MKIGILGGGLAGLALRHFLRREVEVLEKELECGGLCRSIKANGFVFDQGGHMFFSKDARVLNFVKKTLGRNVERRKRNNKVYYDGRFIKYPFENGLSGLSKEDNFYCLYHYLQNNNPAPSNLKEWIYYTFGNGIAEKYLIPYNEKIWKFDLRRMSLEWVRRIPRPPLEDVLKSALGIETEGYLHQLFYLYPKQGGIQSLIKNMEQGGDGAITLNFQVKGIKKSGGRWIISNGKTEKVFDRIVSTLPIFDLIDCLPSPPKEVLAALAKLKYNSIIVAMLGLEDNHIPDYTAIYFPEKNSLFHRLCFMNNFSRFNAPPGKASLIAEITAKEGDTLWAMNERALLDRVISALEKQKIIKGKKVQFAALHKAKYAYIVYDLQYQRSLSLIKKYIRKCGIYLCGRFAEFEYINMDEVIIRGKRLAQELNARS